MGIDVNLYVEGEVTDEELAAAEALFAARSRLGWGTLNGVAHPELERRPAYSDGTPARVERSTGARYYGEGYERGPWPAIYGDIMLMRSAFPGRTVHYGGDSYDDCPEATDEFLAEVWAHFVGPNGNGYWEHR